MSEELKNNNSEKVKKEINIIDLNSINNYMNYKDNTISPINGLNIKFLYKDNHKEFNN